MKNIELDIPMNAKVLCSGVVCGRITHIVLDPILDKVTDVVVKDHEIPSVERLIPVELIADSSSGTVKLDIPKDNIRSYPPFRHTDFIKIQTPMKFAEMPTNMMWPYVVPEEKVVLIESDSIPPEEMAIRRNAHVEATDGRVGKVDEFMINPDTGHITHLVLREGHLWGQKDISIPVSAIKDIGKETVQLTLDKKSIEKLPVIPIHRKEKVLNK
jgi:sporulation protein YlmC with PRC-barrel domain